MMTTELHAVKIKKAPVSFSHNGALHYLKGTLYNHIVFNVEYTKMLLIHRLKAMIDADLDH